MLEINIFKLNLLYFLIAFIAGIILSLFNIPEPKIIYMYPDINDEETIFTDKKNGKEFKLITTEVNCPIYI